MRLLFAGLLGFCFAVLLPQTATAQFVGSTGTAVALPVGDAAYYKKTDTYYRLMEFQGSPPYSWEHALKMAKSYQHEGREGFLAIIDDVYLHYYLVGSLKLLRERSSWVGLSVRCKPRIVSRWFTGRPLAQQSFRAWAPSAVEKIRKLCEGRNDYLPVFMEPTDVGIRWQVARENANQPLLLVAYPPEAVATEWKAELADYIAESKSSSR